MNSDLSISHEASDNGGRYWADVDGGVAKLTYLNSGVGVVVIDRTFVPPQSRGRDIAQRLVERAVDDARANGVKIVPQCPYVAKLFARRPDLNEVRAV